MTENRRKPLLVRNPNFWFRGVSLVEIMVVSVISAFVLLAAHKVMSRTTATVKKGSDMLNTQLLLELIVEKMRSDIRSLVKVGKVDNKEVEFDKVMNKFSFETRKRKTEGGTVKEINLEITYEFDSKTKTLFRKAKSIGPNPDSSEDKETDFRAPGKIANASFVWVKPKDKHIPFLSIALQVISDEPGEGKGSQLSFVSNFFPKCIEEAEGPVAPPEK